MKVNYKTSKKTLQKRLQQNNGLWDRLLLQNGPCGFPRQVLEPPRQPPGSPQGVPRESKGVSRQPLWLLFGSPRPPLWVSGCPLALPRCLQELFWQPGDPKCLVLDRFGSQISIKNWGFVSHVSNIYYPFLPGLCFLICIWFHGFPCYWTWILICEPPIVCHSSSLGLLASESPSLRVASAGDAKR